MPAPDPGSTILVILSNPHLRQEMDELLRGTALRVEFADSAAQGLEKAEALLPITIVIDIDPSLDSLEICRRLRAARLFRNTPLIMLSARENRDERAIALSAGADDFLEKPLDGLELLARLGTISRLNAQRLLVSHLTRFTWMVEHAQEGYLMLDQTGAILYANERAIELLNLAEDFTGLSFINAVERIYLPEPENTWSNWLAEPEPCFLVQPETPTARAAWIVIEALEMDLGSDYQRVVRLRDVTERMSIFQDMRRFHTVVAHKLRTPMSIMVSNLNIIKNKMEMMSPAEIVEYTRGAIGGAERLANEIRKILTYIDAPLALNLGEPASLKIVPGILAETSKLLGLEQVILSLPEELHACVLALTPDALEMILHELLENARKFHPSHTPTVEVSISQAALGMINMRVADNGINLTIEQLRWAWLPYVQGEKDFTGELPGMGLGFPMVATLLWKAGGDLRLRNRPDGPGLVVEMKIPLESTLRNLQRDATPYSKA